MDKQKDAVYQPRKYGPSTTAVLRVARLGEMGAFLDAETGNTSDDILLHKTQQTAPVAVGDEVKVFLYLDPKHRLTASMRVPQMKEGQIARLKERSAVFLCRTRECVVGSRSARSSGPSSIRINPGAWL